MKNEDLIIIAVLGYIGMNALRSQERSEGGGGGGLGGFTFPSINLPAISFQGGPEGGFGGFDLGGFQSVIEGMLQGARGQAEGMLQGARGQAEGMLQGARDQVEGMLQGAKDQAAELLLQGAKDQAADLLQQAKDQAAELLPGGGDTASPGGGGDTRYGWGPDPWSDWVEFVTAPLAGPRTPISQLSLDIMGVEWEEFYGLSKRPFYFPWETQRGEGFKLGWTKRSRADSSEEDIERWDAGLKWQEANSVPGPEQPFTDHEIDWQYRADMALLARNAPELLSDEELKEYSQDPIEWEWQEAN